MIPSANYNSWRYYPVFKSFAFTIVTFALLGNTISFLPTRLRPFPAYQCTWYVAIRRPDVFYWLPDTGADAYRWADIAESNGVPVNRTNDPSFSIYDVRSGDILVLTNGFDGADEVLGHVAYVEYVNYSDWTIHVSEYYDT